MILCPGLLIANSHGYLTCRRNPNGISRSRRPLHSKLHSEAAAPISTRTRPDPSILFFPLASDRVWGFLSTYLLSIRDLFPRVEASASSFIVSAPADLILFFSYLPKINIPAFSAAIFNMSGASYSSRGGRGSGRDSARGFGRGSGRGGFRGGSSRGTSSRTLWTPGDRVKVSAEAQPGSVTPASPPRFRQRLVRGA